MKKISTYILSLLLLSCNNNSDRNVNVTDSPNFKQKKEIPGWKSAESENIKFIYPDNWRVKIRSAQGTTQFGLTFNPDTADIFYPVEIWEFNASGGSFEDFSGAPHEYFKRATGVKIPNLMNQSKVVFKNFEAKKFEFDADKFPVDIITVNGIKNYYMLIVYKEDKIDDVANLIFNSVEINSK